MRKTKNGLGQYQLFTQPSEKSISMTVSVGPDLPIMIETLARPFFPMVRCNYITFEYTDPRAGWSIKLEGTSATMPFLMLELAGIIQQPIGQPKFISPTLIDDLFEELEGKAGLLISFEDIWLPNFLFNGRPNVGDVYRITNELFLHAYRFREGRLAEEAFLNALEDLGPSVVFSEDETRAFVDWSEKQVFRAQNLPPKDPDLQLPTRDESRGRH